jgi:hypothetical protein
LIEFGQLVEEQHAATLAPALALGASAGVRQADTCPTPGAGFAGAWHSPAADKTGVAGYILIDQVLHLRYDTTI